MPKKRVLLISDSLGTPIHARGIYNFTFSVVQILNKLGFSVSLLVEQPNAGTSVYLKDGRTAKSASTDRALICDIVKHFEGDRFRFDWNYGDPSLQRFCTTLPAQADFRALIEDTARQAGQIEAPFDLEEYRQVPFTTHSEHLKMFSSFVLSENVYNESFRRANLGLRPLGVDATGFDLVYIDTPHYIEVSGVPREKIVLVAHDFIPLYDKYMGFDWRHLFVKKMDCSAKVAGNIVFNSVTTKNDFERIYGGDATVRSTVIYPPNRVEIERASLNVDRKQPSNYLTAITDSKRAEQARWGGLSDKLRWNGRLPFFFAILSDEPRKNIADIVKVSREFQGVANFVIAGQIDGNRYMNSKAENFPNLHFTGYISDVQKFDLLRSCHAFLFPSLQEGFGIPVIEAAMFGAPVICADTDVLREVTFDSALYYQPHDMASLEGRIRTVLKTSASNETRDVIRARVVQAFGQDAMAKRVEEFLAGVQQ